MLLRSSSTHVLGSLLSSSSDSPNNFDSHHKPHSCSENLNKISFLHGRGQANFHSFSCISSPFSHSIDGISDFVREPRANRSGFRSARSDGNLEGFAADMKVFHNSHLPRSSRRPSSVLQTIPSFSVYSSRNEEDGEEEEEFGEVDELERSVTIGDKGGEFSFSNEKGKGLVDIEVIEKGSDVENYYYKKMVEENPCNPLFLRNYAQFLYQSKGDIEEYYGSGIIAEPGDGEILSQYARLIWENHHDQERASSSALILNDSHVFAAYASFLWETEEDDENNKEHESGTQDPMGVAIANGAMASASA